MIFYADIYFLNWPFSFFLNWLLFRNEMSQRPKIGFPRKHLSDALIPLASFSVCLILVLLSDHVRVPCCLPIMQSTHCTDMPS